jgi:hypothetical protein
MAMKIDKEVFGAYRKCLRQLYDVLQSHVPFSSLDAAHIVAVQSGPFRELLLGIASFLAQSSQRGSKSRLDGASGHTSMFGG